MGYHGATIFICASLVYCLKQNPDEITPAFHSADLIFLFYCGE